MIHSHLFSRVELFCRFDSLSSILLPPVSSNSGTSVFGTETEPAPGDPRSGTDNDLASRFLDLESRFPDLESRFLEPRMLCGIQEVGQIIIN